VVLIKTAAPYLKHMTAKEQIKRKLQAEILIIEKQINKSDSIVNTKLLKQKEKLKMLIDSVENADFK
jgi:hypothetical protein